MKIRIFCVRHGNYNKDGRLTKEGRRQAEKASLSIKAHGPFKREETAVFSSPRLRATQTTVIICKKLRLSFAEVDWLDCDSDRPPVVSKLGHILKKSLKNVILVGHMLEIEELLESFGYRGEVEKGSVHLIELQVSVRPL